MFILASLSDIGVNPIHWTANEDNCQVAVSESLACTQDSLPVAWQLYLPRDWP
jgi:SRSO17 transposase